MKLLLITTIICFFHQVPLVWGSAVLPYPLSCTKFYMCVNDTTYEVVCPTGQYFDFRTRTCGPAGQAICDPSWSKDINPCSAQLRFLPYPGNCSLYYSCSTEGYAYIYNCYNGRYFSPTGFYCELPEKSGCIATTITTGNNACNDQLGPFVCNTNQGRFAFPLSANKYYDCSLPVGNQECICPPGQYYDRATRDCIVSNPSNCASRLTVAANPCIGALPVTDPIDCTSFYTCNLSGRAQKGGTCANGYYFNAPTGQCVPPNPAICTPTTG